MRPGVGRAAPEAGLLVVPSASVTYRKYDAVFLPSTRSVRSIRAPVVRRQSSPESQLTAALKARSSSSAPRTLTSSSHAATSAHREPSTAARRIVARFRGWGASVFSGVTRALWDDGSGKRHG